MNTGEGPIFDPEKFLDPETGNFENLMEFTRQSDALIADGNIDPLLTFLADKVSGDGPRRENRFYATLLLHVMEQVDNPSAVLHHAINLTELAEQTGDYLKAAVTSRLASSVYLEKGQLKYAATWFGRMRNNLSASEDQIEDDPRVLAVKPGVIRDILQFESAYLLTLASKGKSSQVKREIAQLDASPATPRERHVLASTLAFIEGDLGNNMYALRALKEAEKLAAEIGDYADASIYASRRATQTAIVMGGMGAKAALAAAAEYLERAYNSDNDPEIITMAKEQLNGRRELL